MADKKQDILDLVKARFAAIATPTYRMKFTTVEDCRSTPFANEELPAINLVDGIETIDQWANNLNDVWCRDLLINVKLIFSGTAARADMRKGTEDIFQSIGTDMKWSGKAYRTYIESSEPSEPVHNEQLQQEVTIPMHIQYTTARFSSE